jgi:hypothetical protein
METMLEEIKVLGKTLKITFSAEMLCSHSPNEDDYKERLRANTQTFNTVDVEWDVRAVVTHFQPHLIKIQLRSRNAYFGSQNLALDLLIDNNEIAFVDSIIIRGFKENKEAQKMLADYLESLKK